MSYLKKTVDGKMLTKGFCIAPVS